jgi:hypothetical protein
MSYLMIFPNNLSYTHSIVEERYDGVLSAYVSLI